MCLGMPAKVLSVSGKRARADFGGAIREINISLVEVKPEDYVVVHAGYAIEVISPEEADQTLALWRELVSGIPVSDEVERRA